jgi:hypothetical protein
VTTSDEAHAILTVIALGIGALLGAVLEIYIAGKERRIGELEIENDRLQELNGR